VTLETTTVTEALVFRGMQRIEARRWARFATTAIGLLREAAGKLQGNEEWAAILEKTKPRDVTEPDLTIELYHAMQRIKDNMPLKSPLRDITLHCEYPVADAQRTGKRSKKSDFMFRRNLDRVAIELAIEAKLLRGPADVANSYLSDEGIGCFTTGDSPYTQSPVAAMVAYVRRPIKHDWEAAIVEGLKSTLADVLARLVRVSGIETSTTLLSEIQRRDLDLGPLLLMHLSLDFPGTQET
jgi:hypothetical protein